MCVVGTFTIDIEIDFTVLEFCKSCEYSQPINFKFIQKATNMRFYPNQWCSNDASWNLIIHKTLCHAKSNEIWVVSNDFFAFDEIKTKKRSWKWQKRLRRDQWCSKFSLPTNNSYKSRYKLLSIPWTTSSTLNASSVSFISINTLSSTGLQSHAEDVST